MISPEKFEIQAKTHGLRLVFELLYDLLDELLLRGISPGRCSIDQIYSQLSKLKEMIYVLQLRVDGIIAEDQLSTSTPDGYLFDT